MRFASLAMALVSLLLLGGKASASHEPECPLTAIVLETKVRLGPCGDCHWIRVTYRDGCASTAPLLDRAFTSWCGEFPGDVSTANGIVTIQDVVVVDGVATVWVLLAAEGWRFPSGGLEGLVRRIEVVVDGTVNRCCTSLSCDLNAGDVVGGASCSSRCARRGTRCSRCEASFTVVETFGCDCVPCECECDCEEPPPCVLLFIDEDCIDNGNPPNFFNDIDVNDQMAEIGVRRQLEWFRTHVGQTVRLHTGQVGDEGLFAPKTIPASWAAAGPTGDGIVNFLAAGPGLGTADRNGDREALLDKVPNVTPLRATGLRMLVGQTVCAVVWDSDISINYGPLNGSVKGANLGVVAFEVLEASPLTGYSSGSLPQILVRVVDADLALRAVGHRLFTEAPAPTSSSTPYDVR